MLAQEALLCHLPRSSRLFLLIKLNWQFQVHRLFKGQVSTHPSKNGSRAASSWSSQSWLRFQSLSFCPSLFSDLSLSLLLQQTHHSELATWPHLTHHSIGSTGAECTPHLSKQSREPLLTFFNTKFSRSHKTTQKNPYKLNTIKAQMQWTSNIFTPKGFYCVCFVWHFL